MADGEKGNRKNIRKSKGRKSAEVGKLIFYKECSGKASLRRWHLSRNLMEWGVKEEY